MTYTAKEVSPKESVMPSIVGDEVESDDKPSVPASGIEVISRASVYNFMC